MRRCWQRTLAKQSWQGEPSEVSVGDRSRSDQIRNDGGIGEILRQLLCPRPPSSMTTGAEGRVGKDRWLTGRTTPTTLHANGVTKGFQAH